MVASSANEIGAAFAAGVESGTADPEGRDGKVIPTLGVEGTAAFPASRVPGLSRTAIGLTGA